MPSFFKLSLAAGLLVCACAVGLERSSLEQKFFSQNERWETELDSAKNAAYLVRFNAHGPKGKASGSLELYWLRGDTVLLFSPGLFGKGSLRGRWVLGGELLVYFPREKSYYKGNWEDFLLGIRNQRRAQDSLVFGILSRRAFLRTSRAIIPEKDNSGWRVEDSLGSWEREFIFNRRGQLSKLHWKQTFLDVKAEAEMSRTSSKAPTPKRLVWEYFMQEARAEFEVEQMVVNAEVPAGKKNFQIPAGAVRLEKIERNEDN